MSEQGVATADKLVVYGFMGGLALLVPLGMLGVAFNAGVEEVEAGIEDYVKAEIAEAGGTHGDVAFDAATNTLTVAALSFPPENADDAAVTIATLTLKGADAKALAAVEPPVLALPPADGSEPAPVAERGSEPLKLFETLTLDGVAIIETNGDRVDLSKVTLSDVKLAPLDARPAETEETAEGEADSGTDVPPDATAGGAWGGGETSIVLGDGSNSVTMSISGDAADRELVEFLSKLEFAGLRIEDFAAAGNQGTDKFTIKEISVADYRRGDVGPMIVSLAKGSFDRGTGTLDLERAQLDWIKYGRPLAKLYASMKSGGAVAAAGAEMQPLVGGMAIEKVLVADKDVRVGLELFAITDVEYEGLLGTKSRMTLKGLSLPVVGPNFKELADLGYTELRINAGALSELDPKAGTFRLSDARFEAEQMGALDFALDLSGVGFLKDLAEGKSADGQPLSEQAMITAFEKASLVRLNLGYKDQSLAAKLIDREAAAAGLDRQSFAMEMAAALQEGFASGGLTHPFFSELTVAVGAFLMEPNSLRLTAAPSAPVPLLTLAETSETDPNAAVGLLNPSIVANQ